MAILAMLAMEEGEPDVVPIGNISHSPSSRGGNGISGASTNNRPANMTPGVEAVLPAPHSELYVEFTASENWGLAFMGDSGTGQANIYFNTQTSILTFSQVDLGNASETNLRTVPVPSGGGVEQRWAVYYKLHNSSGEFEISLAGEVVLARTGIRTSNNGGGNYPSANIVGIKFGGNGVTGSFFIDSVVITDDGFLGDCHVDYLVPDGAGDSTEWAPSDNQKDNYELVNDVPATDTDYVEATSDGLTDLYSLDNLPQAGDILAVQPVAYSWKTGVGSEYPTDVVLKTGGNTTTDRIDGVGTSMSGYSGTIHTSKPGGGDWDTASVNNLQIGVSTDV